MNAVPGNLANAPDHHLEERVVVERTLGVLTLLSPALGLVFHLSTMWQWLNPALTSRFVAERQTFQTRLADLGPPELCEPGGERALELGELMNIWGYFRTFIKDRSMSYVVSNLVRPLTKDAQVSYAELVGPKPVMWFVSHYWGSPFWAFVHSLKRHAQQVCHDAEVTGSLMPYMRLTYWICSFSVNQWRIEAETGETVHESSFYKSLRAPHCLGTVLVLDTRASPLRRSWCLFEMLQTMLLADERADGGFSGLWLCTDTGSLRGGDASVEMAITIAESIAHLRVEDAQATMQADKDRIDAAILETYGTDGFEKMDVYLRGHLVQALKCMRDKVDVRFSHVLNKLEDLHPDEKACTKVASVLVVAAAAAKFKAKIGRRTRERPSFLYSSSEASVELPGVVPPSEEKDDETPQAEGASGNDLDASLASGAPNSGTEPLV
uniref:Uncharacterized protein n=1 Tax=Zooxanthella nutricula TaxID=1333877 RepID=A0A7S2JTK0_9DINO